MIFLVPLALAAGLGGGWYATQATVESAADIAGNSVSGGSKVNWTIVIVVLVVLVLIRYKGWPK
ncbi:hypothetical protein [Vibrio sp. SCSIO 43137]|uniref:hypothetical protein n=1 Tax=Vibrio sp. SCSIO 43137 TaxID=3021011 RepID=UPI002307D3F2|nr:hypothetical protein [Vibrio sp. SCSIO 43137]WCE30106.1 hypothetical protein PK654_02070 [Vibrio sp. SCSIO 43137]